MKRLGSLQYAGDALLVDLVNLPDLLNRGFSSLLRSASYHITETQMQKNKNKNKKLISTS